MERTNISTRRINNDFLWDIVSKQSLKLLLHRDRAWENFAHHLRTLQHKILFRLRFNAPMLPLFPFNAEATFLCVRLYLLRSISLCAFFFFIFYFYESSFNGAGALVGVIYLDMWYLLLCLDFMWLIGIQQKQYCVSFWIWMHTFIETTFVFFYEAKKRFYSVFFISSKRSEMNCASENNRWYGFWFQIIFYRTNREF